MRQDGIWRRRPGRPGRPVDEGPVPESAERQPERELRQSGGALTVLQWLDKATEPVTSAEPRRCRAAGVGGQRPKAVEKPAAEGTARGSAAAEENLRGGS